MSDTGDPSAALSPKHAWLSRLGVSALPAGAASGGGQPDASGPPLESAPGSPLTRPPAVFYDLGYRAGQLGGFGSCPADADDAGLAAYDEGYRAGKKDKQAQRGGPPPASVDVPAPGQEMHRRVIYVLDDDGVGTVPREFYGTDAELEEIANAANHAISEQLISNVGDIMNGPAF